MLFNSQIFLFLFLPLALAGWYALNRFRQYRIAMVFLIGMSLWFYGYFNPSYLAIILGSMAGNYLVSFAMGKWRFQNSSRVWLILGLVMNVGILGYYKYYDFLIENINAIFGRSYTLKSIILPLGISFFTLQQISYIIDRSWGIAPHYGLIEYMCYVTFFPQLIAGPIVLHNELIPQLRDCSKRRFSAEDFADGVILFSLGLVKKVLLADTFALFVNDGFQKVYYQDTISAWLTALCYTFELYFDFSGYCDMAVGIGKMFRLELPVNFRSPYKSHSVSEYWQRWHYTLTRFWQAYIYNPLAISGMRKKNKRVKKIWLTATPVIVLFISGVWHGASWTFVFWGLLEGIAVAWAQRKHLKLKKSIFTWLCTFLFTVFAAAIFRSESWDVMCRMLKAMFTPSLSRITLELAGAFGRLPEAYAVTKYLELKAPNMLNALFLLIFAVLLVIAVVVLHGKNSHEILAEQKKKGYTLSFSIGLALVTGWAVISLTQISTFLYFNF